MPCSPIPFNHYDNKESMNPSTHHNKQYHRQGAVPPNKCVPELVNTNSPNKNGPELVNTNSATIADTSIKHRHGIRKVPQPPGPVQETNQNYLFVPIENDDHNHHNDTTTNDTTTSTSNNANAICWRIPAKYHHYRRPSFPTNTATTTVTLNTTQEGDQESIDELSIPILSDFDDAISFRNHRSRPCCNMIPLRMKPFYFLTNLTQKEEQSFLASPEEAIMEGSMQNASHTEEKSPDRSNHEMNCTHNDDVDTSYDATTPTEAKKAHPHLSTTTVGCNDDVILQGTISMVSQENNNGYQTPVQETG